MNSIRWQIRTCVLFLITLLIAVGVAKTYAGSTHPGVEPQVSSQIEFITANELKTQIAGSRPLAIIDVRSTGGLGGGERKIKGAFHVKLRRLKYRLNFSPLKDIPREQEVITYCACPNDEASIRAAQILLEAGFKRVHVLKGGWVAWQKVNGQMEAVPRGD
jgi:rhodanese-related sulfurtransferase